MDEKKILTAAEINMDMVMAGLDPCKAAAEDAKAAIQAYWDDIELRKAELEKQARGYQKQIDALTVQRKKLAVQINDLSSRGQIDAAAAADAKMEGIDRTITTLQRKVRIINTAEMRGDADLYHAAEKAYQTMIDQYENCKKNLVELSGIARVECNRLNEIISAVSNRFQYGLEFNGIVAPVLRSFEKINCHYTEKK